MICYDYDTNSIQAVATKTRNAAELSDATMSMLSLLSCSGHPPKVHILLDNEASKFLKHALLKNKIEYQLVPPPHIHRRNTAERAIQTYKAHFISCCLCGADPNFPAKEWWDRFLPQIELTLNLHHNCRYNPKRLARTALHRTFDYNKHPLAPLGTRLLIHEKADKRATWSTRGTDGWYIGPALGHNRCVDCYVPSTHSTTRIADTVACFPTTIPFLKTSTEDYLPQSVSDSILALLNDPQPAASCLTFGSDTTNTIIHKIATIINRALPMPAPVEPYPPCTTTTSCNTVTCCPRTHRNCSSSTCSQTPSYISEGAQDDTYHKSPSQTSEGGTEYQNDSFFQSTNRASV